MGAEGEGMGCLLVTGGTGFLGSAVINQAVSSGLRVRAVCRRAVPPYRGFDYVRADVLVQESLFPAMQGVDCVIHAAGLAHVFDRHGATEASFKSVNKTGTVNVARAAAASGVDHLVFVSSVSVYGASSRGVYDESAPCLPEGPYGESKYQAERGAMEVAERAGMRLTVLRVATLYGECDPGNVARLMRVIDRGRFVWIGDGLNRKSLIHRDDAARACVVAAVRPGVGAQIFNVSAGSYTMREVVEGLAFALGRRLPRWCIPAGLALGLTSVVSSFTQGRGRVGNWHATIRKWLADDVYDSRRFEEAYNFNIQVGLTEGLRREVAWYRGLTAPRVS